jgi:putative peptidoglycan lipid II flippase
VPSSNGGRRAALVYAQTIYILPVSLFGMSVSNAELPEMASQTGSGEGLAGAIRERLNGAMQRAFYYPSVAAFLALGDSIVALLYQTGKFTRSGTRLGGIGRIYSRIASLHLAALYTSAHWA